MERLCDLFFELSNEDRLSIILKLMEEPLKLTHIAKELDLTVQESSRQLSRLMDIDLVTKDPDGSYVVQPYGRHALRLLPGFQFLTEYVEYFNRHTLMNLPEKFMGRIGELQGCEPLTALMSAIAKIETIVQTSEEYFLYITDQNLLPANYWSFCIKALDRGVQFRCIELTGYQPPEDISFKVENQIREGFEAHRNEGNILDRTLERIDVTMYMNEKEVALLAFPTQTGEFDYLGFSSTDPKVLEWCRDIHSYYWEQGDERREYYITTRD
jgi:predicted transcriptional regulator